MMANGPARGSGEPPANQGNVPPPGGYHLAPPGAPYAPGQPIAWSGYQPGPAGALPPGPPGPRPAPPTKRWLIVTTAILAVVSTVLGVILISRVMTSDASASSHREPPGLSVPTTPGLVHPEDLKNLLLSPAEAGDILQVPGMALYQSNNGLFMDTADPPDCAGIWAPGMAQVYRDTRFIDAQSAELHGPGDVYVKLTLQSLVAFPTAKDAGTVFEDLTRKWDHCARTEVLVNRHEGGTIAVGDPRVVDNVLLVSWDKTGGTGWGCQRALMPRSNVVIDMRVCDYGGSNQAPELVNKVASRIPTS